MRAKFISHHKFQKVEAEVKDIFPFVLTILQIMAEEKPIISYGKVQHLGWCQWFMDHSISPQADSQQRDKERSAIPPTDAVYQYSTAAVKCVPQKQLQVVLS